MAEQGKSPAQGGFALELDDDPFNTEVKVTLTGVTTEKPKNEGAEEGAGDKGDKKPGEKTTQRAFAEEDDEEDQGLSRRRLDEDEEGVGAADDEEGEGRVTDRDRLKHARRNSKRLKRALGRQGQVLTQVQEELAETNGLMLTLMKGNISDKLHAAKSRLEQLRAIRLQAREKDDAATETRAEDEIGVISKTIADLEVQGKEIEKIKPPVAGNAMVSTWMAENDDWYGKSEYTAETAKAQDISKSLAAQGIGRGDPRHYDEIDRLMRPVLKKRFVDVDEIDTEADVDDGRRGGKGKEREEPRTRERLRVAGGGQRQRGGGGGGGGPQVPKALVETFRAAGFDVNTPEVQKKMWNRFNETKAAHGL